MSLRWRLAIILAIVAAVAGGLSAYASLVSAQTELDAGVRAGLEERVEEQAAEHGHRGGGRRPDPPPATADAPTQFLDTGGAVLLPAEGLAIPVDAADLAVADGSGGPEATVYREIDIEGTRYLLATAATDEGAIQIARDLSEIDAAMAGLRNRLIVTTLAIAVATAIVGWLVAGRFTGPIVRLTDTAERIAETQELTTPIVVDRHDEVGRLAASFNAMLGALDRSRTQQHQLVMDASHELRTPLTTLRTNIELLQRGGGSDASERQEILDAAVFELRELSALVSELVDLATDRNTDDVPEPVDLGAVTSEAVTVFRRRTQRTIDLAVTDGATIEGRPAMIERAIANLIDNAAKFSPDDTTIDVRVSGGTIEVADRGPGVAVDDRKRIFDRFYRTDDARTLAGSGLGLAIVKQVADDHGGTVEIAERPGGGAVFTLRLSPPIG